MPHPARPQARALLEKSQKIFIFGHHNPDGDCVGSQLGLGKILEKMGKSVEYFHTGTLDSTLHFVPHSDQLQNKFQPHDCDLIVRVDFSAPARLSHRRAEFHDFFTTTPTLILDHHASDQTPDTGNFLELKDPSSTSACERIFENLRDDRAEFLDPQIATRFLLGTITDSGGFRRGGDPTRLFSNARDLLALGADKKFLYQNLFSRTPLAALKFSSTVIDRAQIRENFCRTRFSATEISDLGISKNQADLGFSQLQSTDGLEIFVRFQILSDEIRISLRSRTPEISVADLAQKLFGGGGHHAAAGAAVPLGIQDPAQLLPALADQIFAELPKK